MTDEKIPVSTARGNSEKLEKPVVIHLQQSTGQLNELKDAPGSTHRTLESKKLSSSGPEPSKKEKRAPPKSNMLEQTKKVISPLVASSSRTPNESAFTNPQGGKTTIEVKPEFPIGAGKALKLYMTSLTDFEKGEILDYRKVHFLGLESRKIKGSPKDKINFGYDNDKGDYKTVLKDHIAYRYEVLELLGKGSFGQCLKCFDHKQNGYVALKIIRNQEKF